MKKYLEKIKDLKGKVHCKGNHGEIVKRKTWSKHYIPKSVYKSKKYPMFCSGMASITNKYIAKVKPYNYILYIIIIFLKQKLLDEFERDPNYLWIDDVFVGGLLRNRAKVGAIEINSYYSLSPDKTRKSIHKNNPPNIIFTHLSKKSKHHLRISLWKAILKKHDINLTSNGYQIKHH